MPDANDRYRFPETSHVGGHGHEGRLGRHVNHDPRSRAFAHVASGRTLVTVRHERKIPVLDQGDIGSCTGNAAVGALGTVPDWDGLHPTVQVELNEKYAVSVYSAATKLDDYPGTYPPEDTGSDGLSVAKVLLNWGLISEYRHAFSLADALDALQDGPVITGVSWHTGMDNPSPSGLVSIEGAIRGGHEFVADYYDAATKQVGFTNSWGTGYGVQGRFFMSAVDWGRLLADDGDATILIPAKVPTPVPTPTPVPPQPESWWTKFLRWLSSLFR
jgi:hypothetical protein